MKGRVLDQRLSQLAGAYGRVITDKALLSAEGAVLLGQQVTREATVLAYNDAFLAIAGVAAFALAALIVHVLIRTVAAYLSTFRQQAAA